ncbi:hypothetical protein [Anthocerotibacter panamensis]|uniref:hypothetical protein n=1 Tax=Anthocerotibacter panamensis TaxID=2857077 RepID=UPI001C4018A9|nr:hypothetical protein [Anthocerotibacter panamensis]
MSFEYTVYTLQVVGNPNRGYQIQSDHKTDQKLVTSKITCGDQDILDLVWSFIAEPGIKDLLPRGIQAVSALRKHLVVERDPDFGEFLYIKDGRTTMPVLKLEEHIQTGPKVIALNLPTLTQGAKKVVAEATIPEIVPASDEEIARNRRLLELIAALLQKTSHWAEHPQVEQYKVASAMLSSALKDEHFAETLAEINRSGTAEASL